MSTDLLSGPHQSKPLMQQAAIAAVDPETKSEGSTAVGGSAAFDLASSQGGSTPRLETSAIRAPEVLSLPSPAAREKWCDISDGLDDFSDVSPVASPKKGQRARRRRRCPQEDNTGAAFLYDNAKCGNFTSVASSPYPTAGTVGRGCWMPVGILQPAWPPQCSVLENYSEVHGSPCHARNNPQGSVTSTVPCEEKLQIPKPELPRAPGPVLAAPVLPGPLPPGPIPGSGSPCRAGTKGGNAALASPAAFAGASPFSDASARTPQAEVPGSPTRARRGAGMSPMAAGVMSSPNAFQDASARVTLTRVVPPPLLGVFAAPSGTQDGGPYPSSPTRVRHVPCGIVSTEPVEGAKDGVNSNMGASAASPVADTIRNWLGSSTITSAKELAEKLQAAAPEAYED